MPYVPCARTCRSGRWLKHAMVLCYGVAEKNEFRSSSWYGGTSADAPASLSWLDDFHAPDTRKAA